MKIIHTSDWHIGQTFYGYDRLEETRHFFKQLAAIIREEQPDALLVSGDIYDVSVPSTAAIRSFTDFMVNLKETYPDLTIVVITGNHDSSSKIDAYSKVWRGCGINIIGKIDTQEQNISSANNFIEVKDKGYIVAIPYINRSFMIKGESASQAEYQFYRKYEDAIKEMNKGDLPTVLMAHTTVAGCDMNSHRFAQIGNINCVSHRIFGDYYDYIALGHIHRPQTLDGENRIRYSGSPIDISFDEKFIHTVSVVEIDKGEKPSLKEVPIYPLRKLLTFPEEPVDFKKALKMLSRLSPNDKSYIRLNIEQEEDLPADCEERATLATEGKECRYCVIKYTRTSSIKEENKLEDLKLHDFLAVHPLQIADDYFLKIGTDKERLEEMESMISEIENVIQCKKCD